MNPVVAALDLDGDGTISTEEAAQATASLKKLDKNGDGKLTEDELRPQFGDRGPGGFGGERGGDRGGPGGGAGGGDMVARMMEFDTDKDGKLSKSEIPERMQNMLTRGDEDKDGFLTRDELAKVAGGGAGGGRGGFGGEGGFRGGFGGEGRGGEGRGGEGGRGGFGNPTAFIDRMMELDTDKDGKLSREELSKMQLPNFGGGRPGEGGRPGGEGGRPGGEGGGRPGGRPPVEN